MAGERPSPRIGGLMDHTESVTPTPVAGILGVVGGALLALGSFLTWAEVTGGGTSVTAKGVDGSDGYITLVAGLVAVVAGIMMARGTRRVLAVLVILAGIVGGGIGLYDALTAKDSVLDAAAEELAPTFGASAQQVRAVLDQAIDADQLSVSISFGLYVVIGGGVVALVGGILGLRDASEHAAPGRTTMPAPPASTIGGPDAPPAPMRPPTSQPDPGA
jgi:uncharacterized membrane protein (TIGR02234 family)